jgi:hypothetical protein
MLVEEQDSRGGNMKKFKSVPLLATLLVALAA